MNKDRAYTTAYGEVIDVGQKFILNDQIYKIEKLQVIRYAGLIASYTNSEGKLKKINIGIWTYNAEKNLWVQK
jgi:hypothetical protein